MIFFKIFNGKYRIFDDSFPNGDNMNEQSEKNGMTVVDIKNFDHLKFHMQKLFKRFNNLFYGIDVTLEKMDLKDKSLAEISKNYTELSDYFADISRTCRLMEYYGRAIENHEEYKKYTEEKVN